MRLLEDKIEMIKKKMIRAHVIIVMLFILSCNSKYVGTEKHQFQRNNVLTVAKDIIQIETDIVLGSLVDLLIVNDYLVAIELISNNDKAIHLFDKTNYTPVASAGILGNGPGEITRIGMVSADIQNNTLWVPDLGKMVLYKFPIDSIMTNVRYIPSYHIRLEESLFPVNSFDFLTNNIVVGKGIKVIDDNSYIMSSVKLDLNANSIEKFGYTHPEIRGKRSQGFSKLSRNNEIIVNSYTFCDLLTICDLNGNLKYNIYGKQWYNKNRRNSYYKKIDFYKDKIIVMYNGDDRLIINDFKREVANEPTKFLVFDCEGNYLRTIETEKSYSSFCVDESNNRIIAYFDTKIPLGYFKIDSL